MVVDLAGDGGSVETAVALTVALAFGGAVLACVSLSLVLLHVVLPMMMVM